jgi:hypothetical protein
MEVRNQLRSSVEDGLGFEIAEKKKKTIKKKKEPKKRMSRMKPKSDRRWRSGLYCSELDF